ncbi:MAG TPA: methyltransferase domain-containing protein, partial [Thermoleophilaceae bacterium]|nr:methyltransferase domain-containing protein [Thermoleophilaceae bacterium]
MNADREPTAPLLGVDLPLTRGEAFAHNTLVVGGSAASPAGIDFVEVAIGGRSYRAAFGLPSPELAAQLPDVEGSDHCRFELRLDTSGHVRGEYELVVRATDRAGSTTEQSGPIRLEPYVDPPFDLAAREAAVASGTTTMWCETPNLFSKAEVGTPVEVLGWAHGAAGIADVLVSVDGMVMRRAYHGLVRPDLRSHLGEDGARASGFVLTLDPSECPIGWRELTVVAVGGDGRSVGISGLVHCVQGAALSPPPARKPSLAVPSVEHISDGRYVPDIHGEWTISPEHHARYRAAATLVGGRAVLDAGCGVGWGSLLLAEADPDSLVAVDISPVAIEAARERAGAAAVDFKVGDLEDLPLDDDSVDVVVCYEAIEHVYRPAVALDELRRVLRPGGILLISSPNRGVYPAGNPFHFHEFTTEELESELRARFPEVRVYRQQTHSATIFGGEADLELGDSAVELSAQVRKVLGTSPGEEMYSVGIASDAPLPHLPCMVVLGGTADLDDERELARSWQE